MANRRFGYRKNKKAEMGIGTMIIFIAMVIVAAVAATLLISTASQVAQQAQQTGTQAIADVSTGFKVVNIQGDRLNPGAPVTDPLTLNDTLTFVDVKLELEAGSPAINMSQVIIEVTDGAVDANLNYSTGIPDATHFNVTMLRDPEGTYSAAHPIVSGGGLVKIHIDAAIALLNLTTQKTMEIKIIPKHGVPTYETFETPAVYATRYITLE